MQATSIREYAEAHAQAIAAGDLDRAIEDLSAELRANAATIAAKLPSPVETAVVEHVEERDSHALVQIRYAGDGAVLTLRTRWEPLAGRPMIVDVADV